MANTKPKMNMLDLLIIAVILLLAIAAGAYMFLSSGGSYVPVKAEYVVELLQQEPEVAEKMKQAIGDTVFISNKEKDTGVIKDVEVLPGEMLTFDSLNGQYKLSTSPNRVDIRVTLESDALENERLIRTGKTQLKVGLNMPVRGKGYSGEGFLIILKNMNK